jgi:hypothetical protein
VASRLLLLPVVMLAVLAARASEAWIRRSPIRWRISFVAALATAALLGWHSHVWSVPNIGPLLPPPPHARDLELHIAPPSGEGKDGAYLASTRFGALISLSAGGLAVAGWRRRVKRAAEKG